MIVYILIENACDGREAFVEAVFLSMKDAKNVKDKLQNPKYILLPSDERYSINESEIIGISDIVCPRCERNYYIIKDAEKFGCPYTDCEDFSKNLEEQRNADAECDMMMQNERNRAEAQGEARANDGGYYG